MALPALPPRFPCWCRATYSWGGETKKDLGFIEGDLIEALNAGDGLWWMGRLRRDPRAIGLFPSNFVKVLDESFHPAPNSRNASPLSAAQAAAAKQTPAGTRSVFRKPFDAYEKLGPRGSLDGKRDGTPESDKEKARKEKGKFRPYASMKTAQAPTGTLKKRGTAAGQTALQEEPRIPEPVPRRHHHSTHPSRSPSDQPAARPGPSPSPLAAPGYAAPTAASMYRAASPQPNHCPPSPSVSRPHPPLPTTYHDGSAYPQILPASRQPSPAPSLGHYNAERAFSPAPPDDFEDPDSPPPPPPPVHRVAYQPSRAPSFCEPYNAGHLMERATTPAPPASPGASNMTPSPLRDAMNEVMSSLQDMTPLQSQTPGEVWSPDEYELVRTRSLAEYAGDARTPYPQHASLAEQPPELDTYVQRMERQLEQNGSSRPATSSSHSSHGPYGRSMYSQAQRPTVQHRKSAYELGRDPLNRTYTTKTNATNSTESSSATQSSSSTQMTSRSIMSGYSAGGFSATSAGSLSRRKFGLGSQREKRPLSMMETHSMGDLGSSARSMVASESSGSGPSYHESQASNKQQIPTPVADWTQDPMETAGVLGGLSAPKAKKSGFFKKMIESAKSTARTGAATARSTIGNATGSRPGSRAGSPTKSLFGGNGLASIAGPSVSRPGSAMGATHAARDMGLGGGDWMQVRRDVNRSNSLSRKERDERAERCEMLSLPVLNPIDLLNELTEGDEGLDGLAIDEPAEFDTPNLALVDKSTRFLQNTPPVLSPAALAQNYVCRPHRSDVQRLRAIFTWVAERITWEEDFEGDVDTRRVVSTKRGCTKEIAALVQEMCTAVGLYAEEIHGYLKAPGEVLDLDVVARPNHFWNAVIVDGEWRIMDCALANPTHPRRSAYCSASSHTAESWYFLARPGEICYTHIPLLPEQQHLVPPVDHPILINLPCACPGYFRNGLELADFSTSMLHLEGLEMAQFHITVPEDTECIAETEARAFARDADGDIFESGDLVRKKAFAQAEWVAERKRFTIKALLPSDEGQGVLKVYAGKRGLMHSVKDNPHPLALALPLTHAGQNPPYEFHTRHPTPHAQRHDLYVAQPQCARLTMNNTFVFCIRQHPSSLSRFTPDTWGAASSSSTSSAVRFASRPVSPQPFARPSSAMSMVSASATSHSGSEPSVSGGSGMTSAQLKPAKLAIQTPSQKIIRLTRKQEHGSRAGGAGAGGLEVEDGLTTTWETVIKIGEVGTWRGLVLADRSARWCVFAEWECV